MAFPAEPVSPSASLLHQPELESDPERTLAMDSALSDPHNGSAEAGGPTNSTTRPPSTPEGIALAYGSLLLMALLPIFFGALRSVRCARGKVGSAGKPGTFHPHTEHGRHGPFLGGTDTSSPRTLNLPSPNHRRSLYLGPTFRGWHFLPRDLGTDPRPEYDTFPNRNLLLLLTRTLTFPSLCIMPRLGTLSAGPPLRLGH